MAALIVWWVQERGELAQQIVQLTSLNQAMSQKTGPLTPALTIQSKSAGSWGETILAKIPEAARLRKHREYRLQVSIKGPDGKSLVPDAVASVVRAARRHRAGPGNADLGPPACQFPATIATG